MKPSGVDGAQAIERLRNGGQSDLAAKVELALSFAYAEGRKDEREYLWGIRAIRQPICVKPDLCPCDCIEACKRDPKEQEHDDDSANH